LAVVFRIVNIRASLRVLLIGSSGAGGANIAKQHLVYEPGKIKDADVGRIQCLHLLVLCHACALKRSTYATQQKKAAGTGLGALRPWLPLRDSYRTIGAPLPRMAIPPPSGLLKTVKTFIDTGTLSFPKLA
jgi:hypothetical protein